MSAKLPQTSAGTPQPLGATVCKDGVNFAVFSENATKVTLCLFKPDNLIEPWQEIELHPDNNASIWHVKIQELPTEILYLFRVDGPEGAPYSFDSKNYLLDPYAKSVVTTPIWGGNVNYRPMGGIPREHPFDWQNVQSPSILLENLIIYEMHIRSFTEHPSSRVTNPGTFLGLIDKIPHLLDLGINAVELMPIFEFNECEYAKYHPFMQYPLYNFWGYSTVNYFSPMQRYGTIDDFKMMVRELHRNGIEVILDVVYNHTGEGNSKGPTFSWKGIDNASYYHLDSEGDYRNFTGCGNTLNCEIPVVQNMILDSLRYWVKEMHVDGFRFDLASILTRGSTGEPLANPLLIEAITKDPVLANAKLIAEPWDAVGLYQLGAVFPRYSRWSEWNDRYRDSVRRFIRGWGQKEQFGTRVCGSQDIFPKSAPCCSINYVTAHDGFTLADLVSYNEKHNIENGEDNRDGSNNNESWNCGVEGVTQNKKVIALRERQMRNFHVALMVSRGVPMVLMGDEYGHTRRGNNNAWCQDNDLNWFLWDQLKQNHEFYRFYKALIHFRKENALLRKNTFYTHIEIEWHGKEPLKPNWWRDEKFIAFTLKDLEHGRDLYLAFNADTESSQVQLPDTPPNARWRWVINTASPSPYDFREENMRTFIVSPTYKMHPFSTILLELKA